MFDETKHELTYGKIKRKVNSATKFTFCMKSSKQFEISSFEKQEISFSLRENQKTDFQIQQAS